MAAAHAEAVCILACAQLSQGAGIKACLDCGELEAARGQYRAMRAAGGVPALPTLNALISAHGAASRLGAHLLEDIQHRHSLYPAAVVPTQPAERRAAVAQLVDCCSGTGHSLQ
jgi:hypothetical protein